MKTSVPEYQENGGLEFNDTPQDNKDGWEEKVYELVATARVPSPLNQDKVLSLFDFTFDVSQDDEGVLLANRIFELLHSQKQSIMDMCDEIPVPPFPIEDDENEKLVALQEGARLGYNQALSDLKERINKEI